jgi:hypothetical protein
MLANNVITEYQCLDQAAPTARWIPISSAQVVPLPVRMSVRPYLTFVGMASRRAQSRVMMATQSAAMDAHRTARLRLDSSATVDHNTLKITASRSVVTAGWSEVRCAMTATSTVGMAATSTAESRSSLCALGEPPPRKTHAISLVAMESGTRVSSATMTTTTVEMAAIASVRLSQDGDAVPLKTEPGISASNASLDAQSVMTQLPLAVWPAMTGSTST